MSKTRLTAGKLAGILRLVLFFVIPATLSFIPVLWKTQSAKAGYILCITSCFLVLEIVPLSATVLFSFFLMSVTGLQSTTDIAKSFTTDISFLFIAILILAISIEETRLHNRLALLILRAIGVSSSRLILGFLVISGLLSMWITNAAVTLMILPIAMAVSETLTTDSPMGQQTHPTTDQQRSEPRSCDLEDRKNPYEPNNHNTDSDTTVALTSSEAHEEIEPVPAKHHLELSKALQLSTAFGANIGGLATLIGAYPNMLFKITLDKLYPGSETGMNVMTFFMMCGPISVCSLFLTWICLSVLFVPGSLCFWRPLSDTDKTENVIRKQALDLKLKELGPMSQAEKTVTCVFLIVIGLWLSRDPKFVRGWASLMKPGFATDSLPAMITATLMFVIPVNYSQCLRGNYTPLLSWKKVTNKIPWDLLLFLGLITSSTSVANSSGLMNSMAKLIPDLRGLPPIVFTTISCVLASALTEVMSNSVLVAFFLPVVATIAEDMHVNPIYYMLPMTMASQFSFMVPMSSFTTIIVYGLGTVKMPDMLKAGVGPKIVCLVFLILSIQFLGNLVFDVGTFPDWAERRLNNRQNNLMQTNGTHTRGNLTG